MADKSQLYSVLILRRDNEHITVIETENYDEAFEVWTKQKETWLTSVNEKMPFVMTKPVVTAFEPGLIFEIRIVPVMVSKNTNNNPYVKQMERDGFSKTFGKVSTTGSDLLDNGYK